MNTKCKGNIFSQIVYIIENYYSKSYIKNGIKYNLFFENAYKYL